MRRLGLAVLSAAMCSCARAPIDAPRLAHAVAEPIRFEVPPAEPVVRTSTTPLRLRALSVEQALLLALEHNRDLRTQQLGPVIAGTFEQLERGVFDPELFAEVRYFEEDTSETNRATGQLFDVAGTRVDSAAGVRQRFSTGTQLEAAIAHRLERSSRNPELQEARFGVTLTQSLLRGFGPAVTLAAVEQASLALDASVFELRGFTEALLADAEIAYWRFVLANEEIAIFENSLRVAERERDAIAVSIEVGFLPEIELAAARAEVARRAQALIDARSRLEDARLRLVRLLNPEADGALDASIETSARLPSDPSPITDLDARVQLAERARPELAEAQLRLSQNRLETIVTRSGLLPRLDVFLSLNKTGYGSTLGDAFGSTLGPKFEVLAGLSLSQLLGNRVGDAIDRAARANAAQAREAVETLRQQVRLEVRLAANEVERARAQIGASRTTRELQEQTVAAEKERFAVGSSTALLVAQAQRDLLGFRIEEVRAQVDYRIALVRLYQAEGSFLARRGITVASPR